MKIYTYAEITFKTINYTMLAESWNFIIIIKVINYCCQELRRRIYKSSCNKHCRRYQEYKMETSETWNT